ncbi:hypothetical protein [Bacillus sp. JJ1474]
MGKEFIVSFIVSGILIVLIHFSINKDWVVKRKNPRFAWNRDFSFLM